MPAMSVNARRHWGWLWLLGLLLFQTASADLLDRPRRELFVAAEKALQKDQTALYELLAQALRDYPLYPYLEYQALTRRLAKADADEVARFLQRWADTPLAGRLRARWLERLARKKDWTGYLRFWRDDGNVTRRCLHLQALLATGHEKEALDQVEPLWLHGRSRPKACDPVFAAWRKAGRLTPELTWQRLAMAMDKGQVRLARYLKKLLPSKERPLAELWLAVRRKPARVLQDARLPTHHLMRQALLSYAVRRQTTLDPLAAIDLWKKIAPQARFDDAERQRILTHLVRRLARLDDPAAWSFVREIDPPAGAGELQEARLLAALRHQNWEMLNRWIGQLPADRRSSERWRYWKARALEALGRRDQALPIYQALAGERSYYGFLAADRIGAPYRLDHRPAPVDENNLANLQSRPAFRRAHELVALERWPDARREWRLATAGLAKDELMAAARLARDWGWNDQAIFTLARAGYWDDLELRFPLAHHDKVRLEAGRSGLDVAWVLGLIRQESAFNPVVRSPAGAVGLMQLMPATARYVVRHLLKRRHLPRRRELTRPALNIELGTRYLADVLERLSGNPVLATAAYNAGPQKVARWLPKEETGALPADVWIELIPYRETRQYVKRVFTYAVIYDARLGRQPERLSQRLRPVAPPDGERMAMKASRGGPAAL